MADKYYQDYGGRARELKGQGKRIIGYLCAFVPLEIINAAGFIPFRIKGDVNEPITKADTEMETIVCPLVRSCFDIYAEWSTNEKVAFEVALAASICGIRVMSSMKHVGVNVAHDPLMTASYIGAKLNKAISPSLSPLQSRKPKI